MAYQVEIGPSALREAEEAYLYIAQEAPDAAVKWFNSLVDTVYSLESLPNRCPLAPESADSDRQIRQLIYGKGSGRYRILFEITGSAVVRVLHIRHGARERISAEEINP